MTPMRYGHHIAGDLIAVVGLHRRDVSVAAEDVGQLGEVWTFTPLCRSPSSTTSDSVSESTLLQ